MEQPVTRRTFFQYTLALACATQAEAASAVTLRGRFQGRLQGDRLMVSLRIQNEGAQAVEVLSRRGSASAIEVQGSWGSWRARSAPEPDGEMRTRAGPRLVWQAVAPGAAWEAGTFELQLPPGSRAELQKQPAAFQATLQTHQGPLILKAEGVTVAS